MLGAMCCVGFELLSFFVAYLPLVSSLHIFTMNQRINSLVADISVGPELILSPGSHPTDHLVIKPVAGCRYFPPGICNIPSQKASSLVGMTTSSD